MAACVAPQRLFTPPFLLCSVANLAQSLAFNLFIHFPGFLDELGAAAVQIGLINSITAVAAIAARPPIGRSMDLRGRRSVILWGNALNVVVCGLYLTVTDLGWSIYVIRIGHGLAEAMLFTALFTYAADFVPAARRTQGLALFGVSGMLPMSLGGLLGDALLARWDYTALFWAATAFAGASLLLSLPLPEPPRAGGGGGGRGGFAAALRQTDLKPLWWVGSVFALALASVFAFFKLYVEETGLGSVGGFFSAYAGAAIFLRIFLGWLPDRIGAKRVLYPALASLATAFLLLSVAQRPYEVALAGLLFGVGHGFTFPILFGILVTRARERDRGSAMAIFTAVFDLGMLIGGPVFGAAADALGYRAMFVLPAVAVVLGAAVFAVWDARR